MHPRSDAGLMEEMRLNPIFQLLMFIQIFFLPPMFLISIHSMTVYLDFQARTLECSWLVPPCLSTLFVMATFC